MADIQPCSIFERTMRDLSLATLGAATESKLTHYRGRAAFPYEDPRSPARTDASPAADGDGVFRLMRLRGDASSVRPSCEHMFVTSVDLRRPK